MESYQKILVVMVNSLQLLVYCGFLLKLRQHLSQEGTKLDRDMRYTIIFIGLSICVLQPNSFFIIFTGHEQPMLYDVFFSGYTGQSLEKIGILIDIASLTNHLIRIMGAEDKVDSRRLKVAVCLCVSISWLLILQVVVQALRVIKEHAVQKPSALYDELTVAFIIMQGTYTFYSNCLIMIAYTVIFMKLRWHYQVITKQYYPHLLSEQDVEIMQKEIYSLRLLIISICQIYLFRNIREVLFIFDNQDFSAILFIGFYASKTIMILGICVSMYQRIQANHLGRDSTRSSAHSSLMSSSLDY